MSESIIIGPLRFVAEEHPDGVRMRVFAAECDGKGQIVTEGEWRGFVRAGSKPDDLDDETLAGFYRRIDALTERAEKAEADRDQLRATVERLRKERDEAKRHLDGRGAGLTLTNHDRAALADARLFFVVAKDQAAKASSPKGVESAERILATISKLLGGAS